MNEQSYNDFVERLTNVCEKYSDKTAITYMRNDDTKTLFTFGEIFNQIKTAKEQFEKIGLQKGDRVAIVAPHSPFAVIVGLSLAYANITTVLIDYALPTEEINRLLEFSDVRSVFTVADIYDNFDKSLITDIPIFDIATIADTLKIFDGSTTVVSKDSTVDPDFDVIAILFSSGTTASVKGVMITYFAFLESMRLFIIPSEITDKSSFLYVLPFHHMAGFTGGLACLFAGCDVGMIEDVDALKLAKGLAEYQPTIFSMVPRVYDVMAQKMKSTVREKGVVVYALICGMLALSGFSRRYLNFNLGKYIFASVNKKVFGNNFWGLGTGASLCSKETTRFFLNLGFEWANFYAMTETNVPTVSTGVFDRYPIEGVGKVDRYDEIKIKIHESDENGVGEIRVKTVLIMKGYFRDPDATAAAFDEDGYFKTGDLGYIDKKDYLHVTGRIKEAIIMHTGKKVAPTDVDSFYSGLMGDLVFASCGVPNKNGTYDEIHLFIEKGELSIDEQKELHNQIMDLSGQTSTLYQLAGLHFIDTIPMTSIKKVKRFQLKELALAEYSN
ncbi:MAG: acyl--CoA ligase [Oscillospiraceae bacterium]|jgi:long-chain acyl-CoA synthetase|nr:acyl--CoA ligase [Oscillospiraceae bacterium]